MSLKDFTLSNNFFRNSTSTPAVGSSKITIGGLCTNAYAIKSLLCIPPDKFLV